ncbi:MAG: hypothetical protein LBC96_10275 [Lachnospiraceae bacterium]|jgi:hypothetical protein|nr:hypothetical protein [Lachnospiraceae bacterium]
MKGISIKTPDKIFFSNDPLSYVVKNDFHFTIFKTESTEAKSRQTKPIKGGEAYPTIYIKGFEKLFSDIRQDDQLEAFFRKFNSSDNNDWTTSYGRFRDTEEKCAVISVTADTLPLDFSQKIRLSEKCAFTNIPEIANPVTLTVIIDGFDFFFADMDSEITYNISLERGFAVYIEEFGAYPNEKSTVPVSSIRKGNSCFISWKIEENENASAFLYDKNGNIIANLPPYHAVINDDERFTLVAYNDFCSVTKTLTVHRTLWGDESPAPSTLPPTDAKGRFRFFRSYGGIYHLYIHPQLFKSNDFTTWNVCSVNNLAPADYKFYSATFIEGKVGVCYLSDTLFTYCEYHFGTNEWKRYDFSRSGLDYAFSLHADTGHTVIVLCAGNDIGLFDLLNGQLMNDRYMDLPDDINIKAIDVMTDKNRNYIAVYSNTMPNKQNRLYFYDLSDDFRNNIFECPDMNGDDISLVKSNAIYIIINGYVYEVSDRGKFSDSNFAPEHNRLVRPITGSLDTETLVGVYRVGTAANVWKYRF